MLLCLLSAIFGFCVYALFDHYYWHFKNKKLMRESKRRLEEFLKKLEGKQ